MSLRLSLLVLLGLILLTGCGTPSDADRLAIYAGRSQALVDAFVDQYDDLVEQDVRVRYGRDAELLAALEEEGSHSPAHIFWANTAGALTAASQRQMLSALPEELLAQPAAFAPAGGDWVPLSIRFRILAYAPERVDVSALPASVMSLPDNADLEGRIGWTPTYSSFQDFITAMRTVHGEDSTRDWLEAMMAHGPRAYPSNAPMLEAMAAGEIDVALTNHYYVFRIWDNQEDGDRSLAIHHFEPGDVGNLALVTGAGILATVDDPQPSIDFLEYLLSTEAQSAVATRVFEYPVLEGAAVPEAGLSFDEALELGPEVDFEQLADLDETLRLLRDVGLL